MRTFFSCFTFILYCVVTTNAAISVKIPFEKVSVSRSLNGIAEFNAPMLYGQPGEPALPVYECGLLLPPDADLGTVTLRVSGLSEESVAGEFIVEPAQPPRSINDVLWPANRTIVDGKDAAIYSTNLIFPASHTNLVSSGLDYNFKVIRAMVYLTRYNPVTGKLYKLTGGTLIVDYNKLATYSPKRDGSVLIPETQKENVKRLVTNYSEFIADYERDFTFTNVIKMAIITSNAVKTGSKKLQAFLDSKKKRGIEVTLVTETEWGTGAEGIRKWLQDNYLKLGLQYLLLIGNSSGDVPMMTFTGYNSSSNCPADFPYAQLNGDYKADKTVELSVGRFPVYNNDYTSLDAIIQKTIDYENTKKADATWRKNALLAGPGYNSGNNMACVPLSAADSHYVMKTAGWKSYKIWGTRWGQPNRPYDEIGTETQVVAKWSASTFGVIDWATHGSSTSAQDVLSSTNTTKIGNKNPGFVFCGSCSNATITTASNLSYSILKNCGMGAIGGTNLTYYGGSYLTSGSDNGWAYKFAKHMIGDSMKVGDALHALQELDPNFGWSNRGPYVLYGDPTIGINTYGDGVDPTPVITQKIDKSLTCSVSSHMRGILFNIRSGDKVSISIYTLTGEKIRTLGSNSTIYWDYTNDAGGTVGKGMYLARIMSGSNLSEAIKIMVNR